MKKFILQAFIAGLLMALGFLVYMKFVNQPKPSPLADYTNRVHSELYASEGVWDAQLIVKPFRPQMIDGQEVGSPTGLRLEWKAPEQPFIAYVITVTESDTNTVFTESREHEGLSLDITSLKPDTKYVFNLQACVDPDCTSWYTAEQEATSRTPKEVILNP